MTSMEKKHEQPKTQEATLLNGVEVFGDLIRNSRDAQKKGPEDTVAGKLHSKC